MPEKSEHEPQVFNSHSPHLRAHFETYKEEPTFENGEPELDEIRQKIANYYSVPFSTEEDEEKGVAEKKENHLFFVDNKMVNPQRNKRAFCVIRRTDGDKTDAWYIDGRLPHVTLLQRLYNYYKVPDDDKNEKSLGFLDDEGFKDIEAIQKRSKEIGKPITWFLRDTTSPVKGREHIIELGSK
ncbi:MAG: hypothetical protein Q8Q46_00995 [Candidatus Giovannonibacteria bacterium]|nr:hypothetical protein [Candidatus Giovannonibacteria bacterium]